jgi:hypothetical protein
LAHRAAPGYSTPTRACSSAAFAAAFCRSRRRTTPWTYWVRPSSKG